MRPDLDLALPPRQVEIRMMALSLGHGTHLVHEGQGLREVFEGIQSFEVAFMAQGPPAAELLQ